jgi:integral membrane protein
MTPRLLYRILAVAEAITWTLLITGMVLKYAVGVGDWPVVVAGSIHGFVFIAYAITAALVGVNQRWRLPLIVLAVATAVVPYATIPFDLWADRTGRLDGGWRTTATEDPRDHTWFGRLFRWMLTHVAVLATSLAVLAVVIMAALLAIGPPKLS